MAWDHRRRHYKVRAQIVLLPSVFFNVGLILMKGGYGEALEYVYVLARCVYLTSKQLGICAIPVFFKVPGVEVSDLGGRTEGK